MTKTQAPQIVNIDSAESHEHLKGEHWGGHYQVLTPSMRERGGKLGVNVTRVPPGRACVPFHSHRLEDEVFYILSGRGVFRYSEEPLREVRPGDCISCPAGTNKAHQLANPFDEDLVYLGIGNYEPEEVATYPDSGRVLIRALDQVGKLEDCDYMHGEGERPRVLELHAQAQQD